MSATEEAQNGPTPPHRLPPGRHGLPREQVEASQRDRLLTAMVDLVAEEGYPAITVQDIAKRAGVSKATFYEYFKDREACFWTANDARFTALALAVNNGYENAGGSWQNRIRGGVTALMDYLAREKGFAKVVFIEALALGTTGLARRQLVLMALRSYFEPSMRPEMGKLAIERPDLTAEAVVDALAGMVFSRVLRDEVEQLPEMVDDFVWVALQPYGGE